MHRHLSGQTLTREKLNDFLDALASLELDMTLTGSLIFREIFTTGFWDTDLSTLQPNNLTTLLPYYLTPLQP